MIDPIFASCTLIAVFVVLLAMGAPIGICIVIKRGELFDTDLHFI